MGAAPWIFGAKATLADMATLPFVRQFAFVDKAWFDAQDIPSVQRWLEAFLVSPRFAGVMAKYPRWQAGDAPVPFPNAIPEVADAS